jgi:hypothetical protein
MTETDSQKRSLGETVNTWVQIVGICIAALWGVYTFVFKEITLPKSAPVNITLNLQLKKIGTGSTKANLTAVEMKISATNPSTREIHLLPSAWMASGVSISAAEKDETDFTQEAAGALRDSIDIYTVQRHAKQEKSSVVAVGLLFSDDALKPSETVARTIIFYVPRDHYDLLYVSAWMPSASDVSGIQLEWALNSQRGDLDETVYRLDKNGGRTPLPKDKAGNYSDKRLALQWETADSEISLWP